MIPEDAIAGIFEGDRRVLAKVITLFESTLDVHQRAARFILDRIVEQTGKALRIGITGVPGVGKSTFIEQFGLHCIDEGHKIAILAIDPSSKRSGGSILADKTRMEKLATHPNAFIRPSPAGKTLGGVARKTREIMLLCEAAGYDIIMVETVGVGQSETSVTSMVDFFLVLLLAGAGDELQGIKKGIIELADALAINKADGDMVRKARIAQKNYEHALHFLKPASPNWAPPVLLCSALEKRGIDEIWNTILSHDQVMKQTGEFASKRKSQQIEWMWSMIEHELIATFRTHPAVKSALPAVLKELEEQRLSSTSAAQKLLELFSEQG